MKYYPENVKLSPNQGGRINPRFIILHHSYGSFLGGVDWISRRESRVSYHYLIDSDGSRTQLVYDSKRAWHAGKSSWKGIRGMNSRSVGVAFWGDTHSRNPSDTEIDSCAEKCIYLMDKFGIPLKNILSHKQVAPRRKNDPSDDVMQRVLNRVKDRSNG